ncbi:glycosyltransferase family 4 protein [Rathayibacter caricis]|uniref:glycosyltransferase family 4 protein n=1 Tax=Rathayibacter caricis TaxID=110936 RepID=UPI001FB4282F|nr:glycosyltransferase family 1 protein [Rathayibacter caricis]MCJ1694920.1 glycosyltransferase family 4 protein [Rathayibacter caricis]
MTKVLVSGRVLDAQTGGNTRYARTVYEGLAGFGVEHRVARVSGARGAARSAAYAALEGVVWPLAPGRDIDVIHFPADTGAQLPSSRPIVSTVHGLATMHIDGVRKPSANRLWLQRVTRLIELSKTVITVSESSARDIAALVPAAASKIVPILHGIDHSVFNTAGAERDSEMLTAQGIEGEYFLYLGNLDPRKNIVELSRAASAVFDRTGIPLLISGAPAWESDDIIAAVKATRGVHYLGRVTDEVMIPLMREALAFCFPSRYEGFGLPVIEAMACGTPVICSDRGSLGEVAGGAALIVPELDAASIEARMMELVNDSGLRTELRALGLANARRFQWNESIAKHAEVFTGAAQ